MKNEVTKRGGKTLDDVKRARVKHPAMDFVGTLENIAEIFNRHNDQVPQEPNGTRGNRQNENMLLREPHAVYLKTCVEMLHEHLKQRRDEFGYNLKPGEPVFIRTSNPKIARWRIMRGRRVKRSLASLIDDYNRIAEMTGRSIIWKISYGPSRDFEIHFNPEVIKWHNATLEDFDPFVAELTLC